MTMLRGLSCRSRGYLTLPFLSLQCTAILSLNMKVDYHLPGAKRSSLRELNGSLKIEKYPSLTILKIRRFTLLLILAKVVKIEQEITQVNIIELALRSIKMMKVSTMRLISLTIWV